MSKIVRLESSNVKRIVAVEIDPLGNVVIIGGRNGQGKSSLLDTIEMVLGGERHVCSEPLRKGQKKGWGIVTLPDLVAKRVFTEKGSTLTVTSRDGTSKYASPQKILDELVGTLTFDPLDFCRLKPAQQLETLRALVGLDFSALDAKRKKLFDERAISGRDVNGRQTQIESVPHYPEAPAAEVSVSDLATQLDEIDKFNAAQAAMLHCISSADDGIAHLIRRATAIKEQIATLRQSLSLIEADQDKAVAARKLLPAPEPARDRESVRQQIVAAEDINKKVRANAARAALEANFAEAKATYESMTDQINEIDAEKQRVLQATAFPIAGLSLTDDGVLFNGVPFNQASSAEQLRISVALGLALNPKLKVLLIRDGSLLDKDSLAMVAEMAEKADAQVWLEKVTSGEGDESCSIVIEDGCVAKEGGE